MQYFTIVPFVYEISCVSDGFMVRWTCTTTTYHHFSVPRCVFDPVQHNAGDSGATSHVHGTFLRAVRGAGSSGGLQQVLSAVPGPGIRDGDRLNGGHAVL